MESGPSPRRTMDGFKGQGRGGLGVLRSKGLWIWEMKYWICMVMRAMKSQRV